MSTEESLRDGEKASMTGQALNDRSDRSVVVGRIVRQAVADRPQLLCPCKPTTARTSCASAPVACADGRHITHQHCDVLVCLCLLSLSLRVCIPLRLQLSQTNSGERAAEDGVPWVTHRSWQPPPPAKTPGTQHRKAGCCARFRSRRIAPSQQQMEGRSRRQRCRALCVV